MGSRLRQIRRSIPLAVPTVGSRWKEDLVSLRHLAGCLGFPDSAIRVEVQSSDKSGHFRPGIVITAGEHTHAFTLDDVPGTKAAAFDAWREFFLAIPRAPDGETFGPEFLEIFHASSVADPLVAERLCQGLIAAGIAIPAFAEAAPSTRERVELL